tara:strand:+ start:852 stop:1016 length:165 start_codon:yes stop_codon:yes gene_type:complete
MSNDGQWKALVASKQLEIDKLKRIIKEMEDDNNRLRNTKDRKKNKRSEQSDSSD